MNFTFLPDFRKVEAAIQVAEALMLENESETYVVMERYDNDDRKYTVVNFRDYNRMLEAGWFEAYHNSVSGWCHDFDIEILDSDGFGRIKEYPYDGSPLDEISIVEFLVRVSYCTIQEFENKERFKRANEILTKNGFPK